MDRDHRSLLSTIISPFSSPAPRPLLFHTQRPLLFPRHNASGPRSRSMALCPTSFPRRNASGPRSLSTASTPSPRPPTGLPPSRPTLLSGLIRPDKAYMLSLVQPNGLLGVDDRTPMIRSASCGGMWAIRSAGYGRTRFGPFRLVQPNGPSYHGHVEDGRERREEEVEEERREKEEKETG